MLFMYAREYVDCFKNPSLLLGLSVSDAVRNNIIKALVAYSKFIGCYEQFRNRLKNCGVHYKKQNAIESFLRILRASDSDILDWYAKAMAILRPNEQLFLEFINASGVRYEEAITALTS